MYYSNAELTAACIFGAVTRRYGAASRIIRLFKTKLPQKASAKDNSGGANSIASRLVIINGCRGSCCEKRRKSSKPNLCP